MTDKQSFRLGIVNPESISTNRVSKKMRGWWADNYDEWQRRWRKSGLPKGIKGIWEEKFLNVPGFLVAAGPSLDKNIHELQAIQGRCPIFAVDAALIPLLSAGIKPDFVITIEGDPGVSWFWEDEDTSDISLICTTVSPPSSIDEWKGPVYFSNAWDSDNGAQDFGKLWSGGNVSSVLFSFAAGVCVTNPTIFVGHDFSMERPEAGFYFSKNGLDLSKFPDEDKRLRMTGIPIEDINGKQVFTTPELRHSCNWTEEWILKTYQLESQYTIYVNATEGGILGKNLKSPRPIEQTTLAEAIRKYCSLYLAA